jgi:hypothetical protein
MSASLSLPSAGAPRAPGAGIASGMTRFRAESLPYVPPCPRAGRGAPPAAPRLKHSAALVLLGAGVEPALAAEIMGHKNLHVFHTIYADLLRPAAREAARQVERVLAAAEAGQGTRHRGPAGPVAHEAGTGGGERRYAAGKRDGRKVMPSSTFLEGTFLVPVAQGFLLVGGSGLEPLTS